MIPMKQLLLILTVMALVGCGETPTNWNWVSDPSDPNNVKVEKQIRGAIKKPTGELTKADLEKVTYLYLSINQLTSVKCLEKLTQLTEVNLTRNQLTSVKGLENLTQLKELDLYKNQLTDVKGLENLTQLKELSLIGNQLTEVPKGLEKLTQLKDLYLIGNQLTSVKGLEKLTQLEVLSLRNNPDLTKAQIDELKKALPECDIRSNPTK
jgi:Leucine-rich repeat (LRR) protein